MRFNFSINGLWLLSDGWLNDNYINFFASFFNNTACHPGLLKVLAGIHRILASRWASARLQSEILLLKEVLKNVKDSVEEARDDGEADYDPEAEGRANEAAVRESALRMVTVLGSKISVKQETVEMVSVWLVYFYDIGQYSHSPEHEPVADRSLSTDLSFPLPLTPLVKQEKPLQEVSRAVLKQNSFKEILNEGNGEKYCIPPIILITIGWWSV